jgi:DNA-binding NarL/FixJ family response regulator
MNAPEQFTALGDTNMIAVFNLDLCMEIIMLTTTQANLPKSDATPQRSEHSQAEGGHPMKILVVDDHFLVRAALCSILQKLSNQVVIMEAMNGRHTMQLVTEEADIDLILLDLNLPDRDGFSVLSELRQSHPSISVVVLSAQQDRESVVKALDLGALGFIPKSARREIVLSALQLVFAGGIYIPREILERADPSPSGDKPMCISSDTVRVKPADVGLTARQGDVLGLMMKGNSNKAICRALNLAEPTVKNHVTAILKALKVTNRTEAVIAVGALGWKWPSASLNVLQSVATQ